MAATMALHLVHQMASNLVPVIRMAVNLAHQMVVNLAHQRVIWMAYQMAHQRAYQMVIESGQ